MWNKWIYIYILYIGAASQERKGLDLPSYLPDPQRSRVIFGKIFLGRARCLMLSPHLQFYRREVQKLGSGAYGEVPTWCTQQICKQTRVTLFCMRLCAYMLQCYKHCKHFWLVPVAIQCWMQVHLCEDSRNNSQATSLFNQSRWHSNSVSYVSSRLIDHYVIFQVAVKVIRNFTQDLLRPFKCSVMIGYDWKSSVWVSWICYFENRWW